VEVQLLQVISLLRRAERNETLLDSYRDDMRRINASIRRNGGSEFNGERREDMARMREEAARLDRETAELHEQVRELCAKLSADDLLRLSPRPGR
jgi:hypothetical protein